MDRVELNGPDAAGRGKVPRTKLAFDYWKNRNATHQPVLAAAAQACRGPIAEFGCGDSSTRLLAGIASHRGLRLVSLDNDPEWLAKFAAELESPSHEFRLVTDWAAELERPEWQSPWGLVFVDQAPLEARAATVWALREHAEYLVVHDSSDFPDAGLFGRTIRSVQGQRDPGRRDYGDVFKSWREFFPLEPWPYPRSGPATLVGSNLREVDRLVVDYARHLPLWFRLGRRVRRAAPQRIRRAIARRVGWG